MFVIVFQDVVWKIEQDLLEESAVIRLVVVRSIPVFHDVDNNCSKVVWLFFFCNAPCTHRFPAFWEMVHVLQTNLSPILDGVFDDAHDWLHTGACLTLILL